MKRLTILMAALFAALSILPASAGNDRIIVVGGARLPRSNSSRPISRGVEVSYAKVDEDWFGQEVQGDLRQRLEDRVPEERRLEARSTANMAKCQRRLSRKTDSGLCGEPFFPVGRSSASSRIAGARTWNLDNGLDLEFDRDFRLIDIDDGPRFGQPSGSGTFLTGTVWRIPDCGSGCRLIFSGHRGIKII